MSFEDYFEKNAGGSSYAPDDGAPPVRYASVKYATQKLITSISSSLQTVRAHCLQLRRLCSKGGSGLAQIDYEERAMLQEEADIKVMMTRLVKLKSHLDHRDCKTWYCIYIA